MPRLARLRRSGSFPPAEAWGPTLKVSERRGPSEREFNARSAIAPSRSARKTAGNLRLTEPVIGMENGWNEADWSSGGNQEMKFSGAGPAIARSVELAGHHAGPTGHRVLIALGS